MNVHFSSKFKITKQMTACLLVKKKNLHRTSMFTNCNWDGKLSHSTSSNLKLITLGKGTNKTKQDARRYGQF